ncbi:MAG: alpha/beta hydrolase fold domain-containing protein [Haliea sp.]|nr:alpha/beta hydrolase fold domain-containing protein [Haliea sp.]
MRSSGVIWVLGILAVLCLVTVTFLRGSDLRGYDAPPGQSFDAGHEPSEEHDAVVASLDVGIGPVQRAPRRQRLALMREYMDSVGASQDFHAQFTPADADGVPAEWVLAPGADERRRVLYIHGGAFVMGSPRSHRNITSRFSEIAGAAVLAIDYRLMPEHSRIAGIEDCRSAYRWLVANGPGGPGQAEVIFVGGDSAGGNLTLSLIPWVRDQGMPSPIAAIALSPVTDTTMGSPSLKHNLETDAMLGPMFKGLRRIPKPLLWWFSLLQNRMSPRNPLVSPVYGDLSSLPPTLVHASEHELLFDDARRYVNRSTEAGNDARLQSWAHVVHVWHMFYPQLTEARQAWEEIGKFIAEVEGKDDTSIKGEHG